MKTVIPTRGGLALRADSIYAFYGLGDRIQPDMGTGLRVWIPAKDEDLEAARGAEQLTAALAALDGLAPPDHVPQRRQVQSWGWHADEASEPVPSWRDVARAWRDLAREYGPRLITALAAGWLLGALLDAVIRGRIP